MNAPLQNSLTSLESALTSLTESIYSHAPSSTSAHALLAADDALAASLRQLATHQANHARIQHLHSISDSLSHQFKSALQTLASLRSEILATPISLPPTLASTTSSFSLIDNNNNNRPLKNNSSSSSNNNNNNGRPVSPTTLLAFARNTARYAAPPTYKPPSVQRVEAEALAGVAAPPSTKIPEIHTTADTPIPSGSAPTSTQQQPQTTTTAAAAASPSTSTNANNLPTPAPAPPAVPTPTPYLTDAQSATTTTPGVPSHASARASHKALAELSAGDWTSLDPSAQTPFLPWPNEEMVARSLLARSQGWTGAIYEDGPAGAGAGAAGMVAEGEGVESGNYGGQEGRMDGDVMGKDKDNEGNEAARREEVVAREPVAAAVEKPRVFEGLDLYDPNEDEE